MVGEGVWIVRGYGVSERRSGCCSGVISDREGANEVLRGDFDLSNIDGRFSDLGVYHLVRGRLSTQGKAESSALHYAEFIVEVGVRRVDRAGRSRQCLVLGICR